MKQERLTEAMKAQPNSQSGYQRDYLSTSQGQLQARGENSVPSKMKRLGFPQPFQKLLYILFCSHTFCLNLIASSMV